MLVDVAVNCPGAVARSEERRVGEAWVSLLGIERLTLGLAPDCGAKVTLNAVLWSGVRVMGRFMLLMLKPDPIAAAWLMVTLLPPVFVSVSDRVWLLPI